MGNLADFTEDVQILEKLSENKINYFSLTLFKDNKPIVSHCNHTDWLHFYRENYDLERPPPVQKYIFCSKLRALTWGFAEIDKESRIFVKKRNDVVEASKYMTLLSRKNQYLTAITLGTKLNEAHLINFLNEDLDFLLLMEKNLFYREA
jgi:hypothetical protein